MTDIDSILALLSHDAAATIRAALVHAPTIEGHRAAVITDCHRGVAFGYVAEDYAKALKATGVLAVRNLRNVYLWDTTQGIGQLAATGPGPKAKIGALVASADVLDASKVYFATPAAEAAFARAGWAK